MEVMTGKHLRFSQAFGLMEVVSDDLGLNLIATKNKLLIGPKEKADRVLSDEMRAQLRKFKRTIIQIIRTGLLEL